MTLSVICLCADWCRVCGQFQTVFEEAARAPSVAGHVLTFHWLDIEDECELTDGIDVDTFPTLLIAEGEIVRFFGPIAPRLEVLQRHVIACANSAGEPSRTAHPPEASALARRLAEGKAL